MDSVLFQLAEYKGQNLDEVTSQHDTELKQTGISVLK